MCLCWAPECFVYARNSVTAPGAFQGGCSTGRVPCYSSCDAGLCCTDCTGWKLLMLLHNRYYSGKTAGVFKGDLNI